MNIALLLLWLLVGIGVVILVVIAALAMKGWVTTRSIITLESIGHCVKPFNTLPQVPDLCCVIGGRLTASRYVEELDLVVNPNPIPYVAACSGFCTNGVITTGTPPVATCRDGVGKEKFDNCVMLAKPVNCTDPAEPVAALGTTYYYPAAATAAFCPVATRQPC